MDPNMFYAMSPKEANEPTKINFGKKILWLPIYTVFIYYQNIQ